MPRRSVQQFEELLGTRDRGTKEAISEYGFIG
jgi:hypothetical protein